MITLAYAQSSAQGELGIAQFLPLILMFVVLYFLMIRPQTKKAKEHKEMVLKLSKGNEVLITGGIYGTIAEINDKTILLDISNGTTIKVQRTSVQNVFPKDTLKKFNSDSQNEVYYYSWNRSDNYKNFGKGFIFRNSYF